MQTTKFLVVIGTVAAVWAHPLPSFAASDSEVQAKMREALRQKMEALDAPAAPAPTAPTPAPASAAKVAPVAPAAAAAPTVVVPVPVEAVAVTAVAATAAKGDSKFSAVPESADDAAAEKLREALRQKIAAEPAVAAAAPVALTKPGVSAVAPAPAPAATSVVANQPKPEPVIAPAFSSAKQERLAALLQQYKADQITPQQYHTQRAAIIAEP